MLVRQNVRNIQKEDIISTFKSLDALFSGHNRNIRQSFTFNMFAEFESLEEVLFQVCIIYVNIMMDV